MWILLQGFTVSLSSALTSEAVDDDTVLSCECVHAHDQCMPFTKVFLRLFQSRTDDKVIRFKRAIGYYSATSKPMAFHPAHYLGK